MHRALFGGLLIGLLAVCPASAGLIIDVGVGTNPVYADSTGQIVKIYATGFVPGTDPQVTGFNLRAQLGDGPVGGFNEPVFQAIDFSGGIWDAGSTTVSGVGPAPGEEYFAAKSVSFDSDLWVDADGLIATLVIDTTGYDAGTSFDLILEDPGDWASDYVGQAAVITNGTITLNAIPEPAVMVQLFGLMAAGGPLFWLRRRKR